MKGREKISMGEEEDEALREEIVNLFRKMMERSYKRAEETSGKKDVAPIGLILEGLLAWISTTVLYFKACWKSFVDYCSLKTDLPPDKCDELREMIEEILILKDLEESKKKAREPDYIQ